jgi:MFS family permease
MLAAGALAPQKPGRIHLVVKIEALPAASLPFPAKRKRVVAALAYAGFLASLMQALIVPLMADLPRHLDAGPSETTWLVTATLLSGAVGSVLFGRLGDLYGKKRMIVVSLACLVLGSLIGALATTAGWLIFARCLQGVTMAVVPLGISALRDVVLGNQLIKAIATISAMVGVGGSLGLSLSAFAAQVFAWQWLFWASALLGSLALVAILFTMPAAPSVHRGRLDVVGVIGLAVGVVGLLVGISNGNSWGWSAGPTLILLIGSPLVLCLWGLYELRQAEPIIDLRIAARRPVLFTNLATIMVGVGMYGMILALPQLIQLPASTGFGLGQTVLMTGLCFAPSGITSLLLTSSAARITHNKGPRFSMFLGALIMAAGYGAMILAHDQLWQVIVSSIVTSAGVSICFVAAPSLLLRHVSGHVMGQASGLNNLARSLGTTISSAVTAAVLTGMRTGQGPGSSPSEEAFLVAFSVSGGAAVTICIFVALIGKGEAREH